MKPFNLPGKLRPGLTFESDSNDEMDTETSKADERQEINELLPKVQSASIMKSAEELREEGCLLASNGDFALALKVFNGAAFHYKNDGFLHELLSQTHLQLGNHWQAVYSAERAVTCLGFVDWHEGYITLGRAQREVGEVLLAVQVSLRSYREHYSILMVSYFVWSAALDSSDLFLSYPLIPLA